LIVVTAALILSGSVLAYLWIPRLQNHDKPLMVEQDTWKANGNWTDGGGWYHDEDVNASNGRVYLLAQSIIGQGAWSKGAITSGFQPNADMQNPIIRMACHLKGTIGGQFGPGEYANFYVNITLYRSTTKLATKQWTEGSIGYGQVKSWDEIKEYCLKYNATLDNAYTYRLEVLFHTECGNSAYGSFTRPNDFIEVLWVTYDQST